LTRGPVPEILRDGAQGTTTLRSGSWLKWLPWHSTAVLACAAIPSACGGDSTLFDAATEDVHEVADEAAGEELAGEVEVGPEEAGPEDLPGEGDTADDDESAGEEAIAEPGAEDAGEAIEEAAPDAADAADVPEIGPQACEGALEVTPLPADADTTFLRGPYLQNVQPDRVTVVWRPATPLTDWGCVTWTLDGIDHERCLPPDSYGQYAVEVDGLPADSVVPYMVRAGKDLATGSLALRTAPSGSRPVRFMVFADAHATAEVMEPLVAASLEDGAEFAIAVGDSVSKPGEEAFDAFLGQVRPLAQQEALWTVIGNHENNNPNYYEAVVVPGAAPTGPGMEPELYYSFRWGDAWFGVLHLADFMMAALFQTDTPEVTWLKSQLASPEVKGARWRLLFIHEPPYCLGWGSCDASYHGEEVLRKVLVPIAAAGGVSAIFSGHMHAYERYEDQGVAMVVAGGGGGGLDVSCPPPDDAFPIPLSAKYGVFHRLRVDAGCDSLVIDAIALDGTLIDHVELPHAGVPSGGES
jgi:predicted phosphodiesterase